MRLRRINQSIWMYGFPTRKHHYTDRGLSKRYNVSEKCTDHSNPTSPYKSNSGGVVGGGLTNTNKAISSTVKVQTDVNNVLPILTKYQLHTKNGVIAQGNGVAGKYISYEEESLPDAGICYYGNITGWHKYESSSSKDFNYYGQSSGDDQTTSRWTDTHISPNRTSTCYPEYVVRPETSVIPSSSSFAFTKVRTDCVKDSAQAVQVIEKKSSETFKKNFSDTKKVCETKERAAETSLLKAVKLEDTSLLCDLLNEKIIEDINATDVTGRTVLSYAVLKNCATILEKILKIPQIDVNKADNEGNSPLHFSAQAGQVEATSWILNFGFEVEVDVRNVFGFTPLMKAALQGRTRCAKLLLFAGASPTMRDTGRGLRAEQWARFCGRYICADVIEKYARNQLLSKTTSYGNWGGEPELGLHFVNGKLQPPAIALQNAINQNYKNSGIKSKLKKALFHTNPTNWNNAAGSNISKVGSFSLVTQLTSAALCVSSPVLPNSSKVSPVVKSLIKPFVIPKIEVTPDVDELSTSSSPDHTIESSSLSSASCSGTERDKTTSTHTVTKHSATRRLSYFVRFRRKSHF